MDRVASRNRTLVTFDLDGVLIDSRRAVEAAYEYVGITLPPDAWGKPATEWLPQVAGGNWCKVHEHKNAVYRDALRRHARPLVGASYFARLQLLDYDVGIVTAASYAAATAALNFLGLSPLFIASAPDGKAKVLNLLKPRFHIDDMPVPDAQIPVLIYHDATIRFSDIERVI